MTSHETATETQRTVTPNCCDDNGLGAALDSAMGTPAELAEIDENLLRAELSPAQRAAAIARRREIWSAIHSELSAESADNSRGRGRPVSFAKDTQNNTGEDERRTREHLSRAEALGPDLHAVVGTSLDKGVELDALRARVDDASLIGCRQWPASVALARCMHAFASRSHMRITQRTRQGGQ